MFRVQYRRYALNWHDLGSARAESADGDFVDIDGFPAVA
jgi:hypothetical protein